jgi:hypothetical protein
MTNRPHFAAPCPLKCAIPDNHHVRRNRPRAADMANAPCPTPANYNDPYWPPTGRLAIRGGRINQWPGATARAGRTGSWLPGERGAGHADKRKRLRDARRSRVRPRQGSARHILYLIVAFYT